MENFTWQRRPLTARVGMKQDVKIGASDNYAVQYDGEGQLQGLVGSGLFEIWKAAI